MSEHDDEYYNEPIETCFIVLSLIYFIII